MARLPFDLDISPDGSLISASFGEINGEQTVRVWNLASLQTDGDPEEVSRLALPPSTPESFVFAPDGKTMYGTSYYTGVSNVFRFDIPSRKYDVVSNASTGFFRPLPQPDGSLIAYEYSGQGLQPGALHAAGAARSRHGRVPRHARWSTSIPSSSNGASARRPRSRSTR